MIFNSWSYLLFILIAIPLSFWLQGKIRLYVLLGFSLVFYGMWRWDFTLLMLFSAWIDFVAAKKIDSSDNRSFRKLCLAVSLSMNLGLLFAFKYAYFVDANIESVVNLFGGSYHGLKDLPFKIILPLGISFYTFQTISYTIDVYRRTEKAIPDFALFATFVTFWPQLIAGPILRVSEVVPQLTEKKIFQWSNLSEGILRVLTGLIKKIFLADNIASLVDEGFSMSSGTLSACDVWVITILFGFQIYFDFAGYSDIAIGTAKMMGFSFPENFNWPYISSSPREFWRRWHISLSSWIRDYLYLPLMGVRFQRTSHGGLEVENEKEQEVQRPVFALFATWTIMGFWHGAGWNFGFWGFYHATMVFLFRRVRFLAALPTIFPILATLLTFFLMMASWIPFRSSTPAQTVDLFGIILNPLRYFQAERQLHVSFYFYCALITFGMFFIDYVRRFEWVKKNSFWFEYAAIPVMIFLVIVYMQQVVQFIYFQF